MDNEQRLVAAPSASGENNRFGVAGLQKYDSTQNKNGGQVFNLVMCFGNVFFIELSTNPNYVLKSGPAGTPVSIGFRDTMNVYSWQLFTLDGPFIRLALESFEKNILI